MAIAADTYDEPVERRPGDFARNHQGAPWVTSPIKTRKRKGAKADLIALCAAAGITVPEKVTVAQLHELLGPEPARVLYGRPSSLGKQIENQSALQKWSERAVALGMFLAPELLGPLAELDHDQLNLDDADARALLDEIAVKGKNAAQAGIAAERGTHTHELTEDADLDRDPIERMKAGEDLGIPFNVQHALVAAWERTMAERDFETLAVEQSVVDDVWRQAGTLDRIVRLRRDIRFVTATGEYAIVEAGTVLVLDVKTGRLRLDQGGFVAYWHGYAVQCASYAQSVPYDVDRDERGEWGFEIDQRWAIIAHLDVLTAINEGKARCRLVLVDLEAGREAGERCVWARQWERRTDVFSIPTDDLMVEVEVEQIAAGDAPSGDAGDGDLPSDSTSPAAQVAGEVAAHGSTSTSPAPVATEEVRPLAASSVATPDDEECIHGLGLVSACTICNGRDAAEAQRPDVRIFPAKYASQCEACDLPIAVGAMIAWAEGMHTMHEECWKVDQGLDDPNDEPSPDELAVAQANRPLHWSDDDRQALAAAWPPDLPAPGKVRRGEARWTFNQYQQAVAILDSIDPFAQVIPPAPVEPTTPAPVHRDEPASVAEVDAFLASITGATTKAQMNVWLSEAKAAGTPWNPRIVNTQRNLEIARAAHQLAVVFTDPDRPDDTDDYVRAVLAAVLDTDAANFSTIPIGKALAALSIDEARRVRAACDAVVTGDPLSLQFSDDGRPVIVGDATALAAA